MRDNGDYTDGIIGDHHIINGAMTLANEFNLRPLQPTDGRLIDRLNEETPDGGAIAFYVRYLRDPYETLTGLPPGIQGVVAEAPGFDGLAGIGFVTVGAGQMRPLACLSSLKVHPNFRS